MLRLYIHQKNVPEMFLFQTSFLPALYDLR